jgi:hypothetical protein
VQRPVGVAVAATVQPVSAGLARAGEDGRDPAQVRERGLAAEPLGVLAGGDEQLAGMIVADRQQPQQPRRGLGDQLGQPLVSQGDLGLEQLDALGERLQRCLPRATSTPAADHR